VYICATQSQGIGCKNLNRPLTTPDRQRVKRAESGHFKPSFFGISAKRDCPRFGAILEEIEMQFLNHIEPTFAPRYMFRQVLNPSESAPAAPEYVV
jgi:hypothetical protein